jgi:hypothetical protein
MASSFKISDSRNSGQRKRYLRLKSGGPIGRCCAAFINQTNYENIVKNYLRVGGSKRKLCYTSDELLSNERDSYYRSLIVGSVFGSTIYLVFLIFSTLSADSNTKLQAVTEIEKARFYLPLFVSVAIITLLLRILATSYLNNYIVLVQQTLIVTLAALGSYQFRCSKSLTTRSSEGGPLTSGGHLPLFVMGALEQAFNSSSGDLRNQLYDSRCDQAVVRASAVNTLAELFNTIYATALIWCN